MNGRDRITIVIVTLVAAGVVTYQTRGLTLQLSSLKWTSAAQPNCLMLGLAVGALLGILIGCTAYRLWLWRRCSVVRFAGVFCLVTALSSVVGAAAAFMLTGGTICPPAQPNGFDPDHLIRFGMAGGQLGAIVSTGLLAAGWGARLKPTE